MKEEESFVFYVEAMPNWFCDMITKNKVILYNCNYSRFDEDEAFFVYEDDNEQWQIVRGGEMVNLINGKMVIG